MRPESRRKPLAERLLRLTRSSASVAGSYIAALVPVAEELGVDTGMVFREAGVTREDLERPDGRLPLYQALRLFTLAEQDYGSPLLGAQLGAGVRVRAFQALGYAAMSAGNLRAAAERLVRFEKVVWDAGLCELHESGPTAELRLRPMGRNWMPDAVAELGVSGWLQFTRDYLVVPGTPEQVMFRHAAAAPVAEYEEIFQCPVRFGQPVDGVRFPAEWLDIPVREADPELLRMMDERAANLLAEYPVAANLANEVRAVLARQIADGEPDLDSVAQELELPARTLQKRLAKQGLKFQRILEELRYDLARMYLENGDLNCTEIAFLLGFSEQSAFTRAFRRWSGVAPGAWVRAEW